MDSIMFGLLIVLFIALVWYFQEPEGFRGRRGGRWPYYVGYDPSRYYSDEPNWYESPYIFFNRRKPHDNLFNQAYWQCFELNKSGGVSNEDAYRLCRRYID